MKLKKALSGVLAAAMVVSLTPAMAFATTSSTVKAVPAVAENELMPETQVDFEIKDTTAWASGTAQQIKLTFDNAKWNTKPKEGTASIASGKVVAVAGVVASEEKAEITIDSALAANDTITVKNVADADVVYTVGASEGGDADAQAAALKTAITGATGALYEDNSSSSNVVKIKAKTTGNKDNVAIEVISAAGEASVTSRTDGASEVAEQSMSFKSKSGTGIIASVVAVDDNSIEFRFTPSTDGFVKGGTDDIISLIFTEGTLKTESADGPVTITIDGLDSNVTTSTVTIANVGSSNTVATVTGSVKTIARESGKTLEGKIEIRETAVNSITGDQVAKLTLPKGVTWDGVTINGTLFSGSMGTEVGSASEVNSAGKYYLANSDRSLYIYLKYTSNASNTVRDVATITPTISVGKTAVEGDITVDLTSYKAVSGSSISDASDLVVAKYGSEGVKVSTCDEEDIPEIVAGYEKTNKDKLNYVQITIKESVAKSLTSGKLIDFDFPEEVQPVSGAAIKAYIGTDADIDDAKNYSDLKLAVDFEDDDDKSDFSIEVPVNETVVYGSKKWDTTKNQTLNLFVPVTVRADYIGDIAVNVSGSRAGIDETELVVAKSISPIAVETSTTDVKNGVQKQATADVTITENIAGYLKDGKDLVVDIDDLFGGLAFASGNVKAEVVEGDLSIDTTTVAGGNITIKIKDSSTKASTIKITGLNASLSRVLPEGEYDLDVYGSAVIDNGAYDGKNFSTEDNDIYAAVVKGYINVITPAESVTVSEKVDAKFVIGEASYTNNGAATEMDAAAYIDSHNRTMVPIRYVANACGISENDIRWEAGSQTAIINGLNTVVTVKMGSNKLQTSTGEITMDTVAVNNNGRIYVPVRYIANALGANVSWDAATKTVTLTK